MHVLSLFSGIGALDLGLERAGMTVVGQVEIDPFCRRVLAKHWPHTERHDDVRTAVQWWQSEPRSRVDVVAGGFPCQPFSRRGRRRGTADARWGWPWMAEVVRALRPRYVIVENVPALLGDGEAFGWLLGDLAALGFDAEWDMLSACTFGAPHTRERLFVLADAAGGGCEPRRDVRAGQALLESVRRGQESDGSWPAEPDVDRVAHRAPDGVDRRKGIGNAVVPLVGEYVGRLVMGAVA